VGRVAELLSLGVMRSVYALLVLTAIAVGCHKQMKPQLDESKAKDYIGKTVLIGVTYLDHEERQTSQQQWYGVITEVSNAKGIVISLKNDTNYCALPPDLSALQPAKPGEYRLRATGEVVTDPDFLTTWTRRAPDPKERPRQ
jgi:hypothetical protein